MIIKKKKKDTFLLVNNVFGCDLGLVSWVRAFLTGPLTPERSQFQSLQRLPSEQAFSPEQHQTAPVFLKLLCSHVKNVAANECLCVSGESWRAAEQRLCLYIVCLLAWLAKLLLSHSRRCKLSVWAGPLLSKSPEWVGSNYKAEGTWNVMSLKSEGQLKSENITVQLICCSAIVFLAARNLVEVNNEDAERNLVQLGKIVPEALR